MDPGVAEYLAEDSMKYMFIVRARDAETESEYHRQCACHYINGTEYKHHHHHSLTKIISQNSDPLKEVITDTCGEMLHCNIDNSCLKSLHSRLLTGNNTEAAISKPINNINDSESELLKRDGLDCKVCKANTDANVSLHLIQEAAECDRVSLGHNSSLQETIHEIKNYNDDASIEILSKSYGYKMYSDQVGYLSCTSQKHDFSNSFEGESHTRNEFVVPCLLSAFTQTMPLNKDTCDKDTKKRGTQTDTVFDECCRCNMFSLPLTQQVALRLKNEMTKRLTSEQLVNIVEQEVRDLRMQLITERNNRMQLERDILDIKASLNIERHLGADYKSQCDELGQSLEGARQIISSLEKELASTNYFKSGIDYMLESKLATSKLAETQTTIQVLQNELLQSRHEVQRLLERHADANREKSEMVSGTVHQELLRISDEKAKSAELKVQQLEDEFRLHNTRSESNGAKQYGDSATALFLTRAQNTKPSNQPPVFCISRLNTIPPPQIDVNVSCSSVLPDITSLISNQMTQSAGRPDVAVVPLNPLLVTSNSDEDSWSSNDENSTCYPHTVADMKKQWEKQALSSNVLAFPVRSQVAKPAIPRKPKVPPKPILKPPMMEHVNENISHMTCDTSSMTERAVSFDQMMFTNGQLKVLKRSKGPTGRQQPTRRIYDMNK